MSPHRANLAASPPGTEPPDAASPRFPPWASNAIWIACASLIAAPFLAPRLWHFAADRNYPFEVAVTLATFAVALLAWARLRATLAPEAALFAAVYTPTAAARISELLHAGAPAALAPTTVTRLFSGAMLLSGAWLAGTPDGSGRERGVRRALLWSALAWATLTAGGLALVALDGLSLAAFQSFAEGFFAACCVAMMLGVTQRLCRNHPGPIADALRIAVVPFAGAAAMRLLPLPLSLEERHFLVFGFTLIGHAVAVAGLLLDVKRDASDRLAAAQRLSTANTLLASSTATISELGHQLSEKSQEVLRFSSRARMLESAVETMSLGVTVTDLDGRIVYVNRADATLHGYEPTDLVGRPASIFQDPDSEPIEPPTSPLPQPWTRETWNRSSTGARIPVRLVSDLVRGDAGEPVGKVTVCEDIREERRLDRALSRRIRILTACGEIAERLFVAVRPRAALAESLRILADATESDLAHFECSPELSHYRHSYWRDGRPPSAPPACDQNLDPSVGGEAETATWGPVSILPAVAAEKLRRHGLESVARIRVQIERSTYCTLLLASREGGREWNEGELESAAIAARSLAAAIRRESIRLRLEAGEMRFQRLVHEASDLIQSVDADGRLLYVNAAWARVLGCPADLAAGRPILELVAPESRAAWEGHLRELLAAGGSRRIEIVLQSLDGGLIEVEGALSVQSRDDGAPFLLGIFRDIGERRSLERLQQEFLATVSHELRTPLTSLLGSLMLMRNDRIAAKREQWTELLDIAERNGDRLLRLINDLLDLRKLETRGLRVQLAPVPAAEVLRATEEGIRGFADSYGISVVTVDETGGGVFHTDKERLVQVLFNLLSNAIKFSPRLGIVELAARDEQDRIVVEVTDAGPGISPALRPRLFEPFVQSEEPNERARGGSGLGLAIAKGIVTSLNGEIRIESPPDGGTRVRVFLPKAFSLAPPAPATPDPSGAFVD